MRVLALATSASNMVFQGRDGQGGECQGAVTSVGQGQVRDPRLDPNRYKTLSQGRRRISHYRGT